MSGRDVRLHAELRVVDREAASALMSSGERMRQQRRQLRVVGNRDRRRRGVGLCGRELGGPHVRMYGERVHDRPGAPAGFVRRSEVLDEPRRRMRVALRARAVGAARGECAADHLNVRRDGLQGVVGACQQIEVALGRRVAAVGPELGQPEGIQIWLVAADDVADLRKPPGERRGVRGKPLPGGDGSRGGAVEPVPDEHENLHPLGVCGLDDVAERQSFLGRRRPRARCPHTRDHHRVEAGVVADLHQGGCKLRIGLLDGIVDRRDDQAVAEADSLWPLRERRAPGRAGPRPCGRARALRRAAGGRRSGARREVRDRLAAAAPQSEADRDSRDRRGPEQGEGRALPPHGRAP